MWNSFLKFENMKKKMMVYIIFSLLKFKFEYLNLIRGVHSKCRKEANNNQPILHVRRN